MIRVHLEGFLATPEYRQLVRLGRRTVLLLYYHLKVGRDQPCSDDATALGTTGAVGVSTVAKASLATLLDGMSDSGAFSPHRSPSTQLSPTWSPTSPQPLDHVCANGAANKHISTMDSVEITAWLARGGRRSSTITASTGSTPLGACSPQISELFSPVNHTDMRELKNFIR